MDVPNALQLRNVGYIEDYRGKIVQVLRLSEKESE